ncbi:MAG: hypothetical protein U1F43_24450 [Myxococcota bacterium]
MDPGEPPSGSFGSALSFVARKLALENAFDLKVLSSLNEARFKLDHATPAWAHLQESIKGFLVEARRSSYPVRLLRNVLPTSSIMNSTDQHFSVFLRDLLAAISTADERVAHWYRKKLVVYKAVIDLPFAPEGGPLPEIRKRLLSLGAVLSSEEPGKPAARSASRSDTGAARPGSMKEKSMGATFDLYGPESLKRSIFQYWVYDTNTDEIATQGSFIAKGDTLQEATRNLMEGLRVKLGNSAPNPNLKVHVKMIDQFTKQASGGQKSLAEQFVEAVRDEIRREQPKQ